MHSHSHSPSVRRAGGNSARLLYNLAMTTYCMYIWQYHLVVIVFAYTCFLCVVKFQTRVPTTTHVGDLLLMAGTLFSVSLLRRRILPPIYILAPPPPQHSTPFLTDCPPNSWHCIYHCLLYHPFTFLNPMSQFLLQTNSLTQSYNE